MKPVTRYQSRLLIRRAFKPNAKRKNRLRVPVVSCRPARASPIPILIRL
jgi:hypothetical protein